MMALAALCRRHAMRAEAVGCLSTKIVKFHIMSGLAIAAARDHVPRNLLLASESANDLGSRDVLAGSCLPTCWRQGKKQLAMSPGRSTVWRQVVTAHAPLLPPAQQWRRHLGCL